MNVEISKPVSYYPFLGKNSNGTYVLFFKHGCGTVVGNRARNKLYKMGWYSTNWEMRDFERTMDNVTLSNFNTKK